MFFYLLCLVACVFGVFFYLVIQPSVRFYRMLIWLEIDLISAQQRTSNNDFEGLLGDVQRKLRERGQLICHKTAAAARKLRWEGELDQNIGDLILAQTDSLLEDTNDQNLLRGIRSELFVKHLGPRAKESLAPLLKEWDELGQWQEFFDQVIRHQRNRFGNQYFRGP